jgi:hypothetical protein
VLSDSSHEGCDGTVSLSVLIDNVGASDLYVRGWSVDRRRQL